MLVANPIQNKDEQKTICELCGIPFRPEAFAYSQRENGKVIAAAQFDISLDGGILLDIQMKEGLEDDIEALFILGRAVLNFLDLSEIKICTFPVKNEHDKKMAKMLGFKEDGEIWKADLNGMFSGKCHND
ncbi:MAG: hypothetical protein IKV53_05075 [Clostridia bacterium]|nr:hypothetical protein [Clostridia bacterium]